MPLFREHDEKEKGPRLHAVPTFSANPTPPPIFKPAIGTMGPPSPPSLSPLVFHPCPQIPHTLVHHENAVPRESKMNATNQSNPTTPFPTPGHAQKRSASAMPVMERPPLEAELAPVAANKLSKGRGGMGGGTPFFFPYASSEPSTTHGDSRVVSGIVDFQQRRGLHYGKGRGVQES